MLLIEWASAVAVIALLGGELAARIFLRARHGQYYKNKLFNYFLVDHPVYGFAFRKNSSTQNLLFPVYDQIVYRPGTKELVKFTVNSLGFRGPEFSPKKRDPKTTRIFCSGGSTTACVFVDDEETWPAALQRELRARGHNVEVINAGVGAWYSYQERLRFEQEVASYEPDIVVLHQGWNEEFVYAMQNLGRAWHPGLLMNAVELQSMYSRVGRILSSTASVFLHLLAKSYFLHVRFKKTMSATNPERWKCLKARAYIEHWFDNLQAMARVAAQKGIKLYTINPPGLLDFEDLPGDRRSYVELAGISPEFADYVAVAKKRMQKTLLEAGKVVPCLDLEKEYKKYRGPARLGFFLDEFHLSAAGNAFLGKQVAERLNLDKSGANVTYDEKSAQQIRQGIGGNYGYIDDYLEKKIHLLRSSKQKGGRLLEMPMQRYTTF